MKIRLILNNTPLIKTNDMEIAIYSFGRGKLVAGRKICQWSKIGW